MFEPLAFRQKPPDRERPFVTTNSIATAHPPARDIKIRDWLVFMLTVSSGAVDVISFLALGKVFTAAMSGNFALLGIGIAGDAGAPSVISVLARR